MDAQIAQFAPVISLRLARPDDAPALRALIARSFAALGTTAYAPEVIAALVRSRHMALDAQLLHDGTLWAAEWRGVVVACAGWTWREPPYGLLPGVPERVRRPGLDAALVRSVFVDPAQAGRGLGRRLLTRVEDDLRRAGYDRAELLATLNAVPMYTHCGWRVLTPVEMDLGDGLVARGMRMQRQFSGTRLAIV